MTARFGAPRDERDCNPDRPDLANLHGHHARRGRVCQIIAVSVRSVYIVLMSIMNAEMYDALIAAGAPEDKAKAAATAMSEDTLATKADIARLERDLTVIKWMLALVIAATVLPLIKDLL